MILLENEYGNLSTIVTTKRELDRHLENGWHIVKQIEDNPTIAAPAEEPKTKAAPAAKKPTKKAAKKK